MNRHLIPQQEPVLFRGTVYENICKGLIGDQRHLSSEEKMNLVREACISSNADSFIQELPNVRESQSLPPVRYTLTIDRVIILRLASELVCFLEDKSSA